MTFTVYQSNVTLVFRSSCREEFWGIVFLVIAVLLLQLYYYYKPLIHDVVDISKNEKQIAFPIKTFYHIG